MLGCYLLGYGRWLPDTTPDIGDPNRIAPSALRLDSILDPVALVTHAAFFAARPIADARVPPDWGRLIATWWPVAADSLGIVWSSGFEALRLRFAIRGDTLRGRAGTGSDYLSPLVASRANAYGVRIPCSGDPGSTAAARAALQRLVSADRVDSTRSIKELESEMAEFTRMTGPPRARRDTQP
jgi:hypothetical protein